MGKPSQLASLVRKYQRDFKHPLPIGQDGRIRVSSFIDLLSAAHNSSDLSIMVEAAIPYLQKNYDLSRVDALVGLKWGNLLFSYSLGKSLGLETAFMRNNILFDSWIEGAVKSGNSIILVDDIASDGEKVYEAIEYLRKSGVYTQGFFTLIDRADGDTTKYMNKLGVKYDFILSVDDQILKHTK